MKKKLTKYCNKYEIIGNFKSYKDFGSKALSLIELSKLNLTPYFVILSYNFLNDFFKLNENFFEFNDINNIKKDLKKVQLKNLAYKLEPYLNKNKKYIIRSSYKYEDSKKFSFAGIFESTIASTIEEIPSKILSVYSSMFSEKFLAYYSNNFNSKKAPLCMNIIIQEYIEPLKSGVVFTYKNKDTFYIEETNQQNKSVEEGNTTPLQIIINNGIIYHITPDHIHNMDTNPEEYYHLYNLYENIKKIPEYCNRALDIEYILDKDKNLKIVQYRPVTKEIKLNNFYVYLFTIKNEEKKDLIKIEKFIKDGFKIFFDKKIQKPIFKGSDVYIKFNDYSNLVNEEIVKIENIGNYHIKLSLFYLEFLRNSIYPLKIISSDYFYSLLTYTIILIQINDKIDEYFGKLLFFKLKVKEKEIKAKSYYAFQIKRKHITPHFINFKDEKIKNIKIKENIILMHDFFDYYTIKIKEAFAKHLKSKIEIEFYPAPFETSYNKNKINIKKPCIIEGKVFSRHNLPCQGISLKGELINNKNIQKNSILIMETFSPSYVPYLFKSKAIITKEGGYLSHAAIVAREFKKPAIGNVDIDLIENNEKIKILKDGKIFLSGKNE